jgi:CubicO group peptidase (beta-lactamase class C family)
LFLFAGSPASGQSDLPPALLNRPPVAAPTSQIDVAPIEVVRSQSEVINDFGGGLIQGLLFSQRLRNAVLVAAQDSRVIVIRGFGSDAGFKDVLYSDLLAPLAVLQLIERQRVKLEDNISAIVAGYGPAAATVGDALTHRADPSALRRIVEASSGQDFRSYVSQSILAPLTSAGGEPSASFTQIVGRLLVVLLNGGAFEGTQILAPETIALLEKTEFSIHPALPGWTYGFVEMRRNGRRALQRDGVWMNTPAIEARMVVVPEAHLAYFIIVEGQAGAPFWRMLDEALFDRILPPDNSAVVQAPQSARPDAAQARAVAGSYEASDEPLALAAPLKSAAQGLVVRAAEDASLHLSGGENAVLTPRPGGYWAAEGENLTAVVSEGRLVLSSGIYRPLRWWKRPALYASLALLSAFGAAGLFVGERRAQRASKTRGRLAVAFASAFAAFLAAALLVWHLSPAL